MKKNFAPYLKLLIIFILAIFLLSSSGIHRPFEVEEFERGGINLEKTINIDIIDQNLISSESLLLGIFKESKFINEIIICFEEEGVPYLIKNGSREDVEVVNEILFKGESKMYLLQNKTCFKFDRRDGLLNYNVSSTFPVRINPNELTERVYINGTDYHLASKTMEYFLPGIKITAESGGIFKLIWFIYLLFISGIFIWILVGLYDFIIGRKNGEK